jgi:hypothetical protein
MSRWSNEQDALLLALAKKNIVNYNNIEPDYLFDVTQEHFPNFIGTVASAHLATI